MGENHKANPGRQPCGENKEGDHWLASFQQTGLPSSLIPGDKERTLRKNKKEWGVGFNPQFLRFAGCHRHEPSPEIGRKP